MRGRTSSAGETTEEVWAYTNVRDQSLQADSQALISNNLI